MLLFKLQTENQANFKVAILHPTPAGSMQGLQGSGTTV